MVTEADWFNPDGMAERKLLDLNSALRAGEARVTARSLRFFCCACCRQVEQAVPDERVKRIIRVVERHLDGLATNDALREVADAAERAWEEDMEKAADRFPSLIVWLAAPLPRLHLMEAAAYAAGRTPGCIMSREWAGRAMQVAFKCRLAITHAATESEQQAKPLTSAAIRTHMMLLHDCLGNPFHPATLQPEWQQPKVRALAQGIYQDRVFDSLPVLADALEEAGCTDADIPGHCRGPGPHVRGCWLLNLVLAKEGLATDSP